MKGEKHREEFINLEAELEGFRRKNIEIERYCDKYYAHQEIEPVSEQSEKNDYGRLQMSWDEVKEFINQAKRIFTKITLFWGNSECDFAENQYDGVVQGFWKLTNLPSDTKNFNDLLT